jgi:2,4-dienoyl-CoA reductase-like NADH-dependent reductase (Old Yellow Enzyme family)
LVQRYRDLAKGGIGLIIPGYAYVHPAGRAMRFQTGIHHDDLLPGLKRIVDTVHGEDGKIIFQLVHSGRQTTPALAGRTPLGPSSGARDPINFIKPQEMQEADIQDAVRSFGSAARRAVEAGADGIQLHAAHGYLINQFLSPFFNRRSDHWGSSHENCFRFLKEVFLAARENMPQGMPLLVKLNTHDHTPKQGITPSLARTYAGWLAELGVDGIEVSCGSSLYSFMNMCRGDVPVDDFVKGLPWWKRPLGRLMMKRLKGKYELEEGYNLGAATMIRPAAGSTPLLVVGGMRTVAHMEHVLEKEAADFISMSRPFIREPFLVRRIREGKTDRASCISCNRCLAAVANDRPLRCYRDG